MSKKNKAESESQPTAPTEENEGVQELPKIFWLNVLLGLIFFSCLLWALSYYFQIFRPEDSIQLEPIDSQAPLVHSSSTMVSRLIDGKLVEPGNENNQLIAVIIENHPDARPPAGLSQAHLVYEAESEGKITRFLAVFSLAEKIEKIGPIRSARPYFADWAGETDALLAHCGGSPEALVKIKQEKIFNLNEFYNGQYFWRDKALPAPHNIFTSSQKLADFLQKNERLSPDFASWKYKDELEEEKRPETSRIDIVYSRPDFVVKWEYNKISNSFLRFQSEEAHTDNLGKQITAKNVVLAYMASTVLDKELRLKYKNIGSGQAVVCLDGTCRQAVWRKNSSRQRMFFEDSNGQEIALNRGTAWIEIVQPSQKITY